MLISCFYWLFRHLLGLAVLRCRSEAANEVEILVLRHDGRGCSVAVLPCGLNGTPSLWERGHLPKATARDDDELLSVWGAVRSAVGSWVALHVSLDPSSVAAWRA